MDDLFDFFEDGDSAPAKPSGKASLSRPADVSLAEVFSEITEEGDDGVVVPVKSKRSRLDEALVIDTNLYKNRITIHGLDAPEGCTHEVVCPPDVDFTPLEEKNNPAKVYSFELDPFQKRAVLCIDNLQSVLVSAHTSAGKTVVAEYSIALALKKKQRVLYTTPIKALSNQKYREFADQFDDVGLMTGDVTINPNASCLIMTTEILRSMLYRGSEILREVGWVIFDEIHYMRNKERGYVWEETIILLQDEIRLVFLSATVPNARQFAEWVVTLHHQPVHVVYTEYRPVPLQHYVYPCGAEGIHLIVDEKGEFREANFMQAMASIQGGEDDDVEAPSAKKRKKKQKGDMQTCMRLVRMIMEHDLAPVIIFSFAKRECENYAGECGTLDFNTAKEKLLVKEVFENAIDILNEEDKNLPQVKNILPLLMKGIGIHHGGLLPILKETIEILFGEGLIKALFATETFAMGLNMPARTVMFTNARKYDGKEERWLHGAEYIQMSGRAGRRGKDDKGVVILMVDEKMSPAVGRNLLKGNPEQLTSAFQLTYNMVLNLIRVDGINPEFMLQRSFHQFQSYKSIPELLQEIDACQKEFESIELENEEDYATYHKIVKVLEELQVEHHGFVTLPKYLVPFLNPGRLVEIKQGEHYFGWGMIVTFKTKSTRQKGDRDRPSIAVDEPEYDLHVLLRRAKDAHPAVPPRPGEKSVVDIVAVGLGHISKVSSVRLKFPEELRSADEKARVVKTIDDVKRRFAGSPPLIDPVTDMKINDDSFKALTKKLKLFEDRLKQHPLYGAKDLNENYAKFVRKVEAEKRSLKANEALKNAQELIQMDELKKKQKILKYLQYCSNDGVLLLKGRVACELSSADELLLTEMLFNGVFNDLEVPHLMALLSCLVCDENSKSKDGDSVPEELSGSLRIMQNLARELGKTFKNYDLQIEVEEYVGQFKPFLMHAVFEWCKGANFAKILTLTDIFEGSIIRCMRRLEEATRQLIQAARGIGNADLEKKFQEGIRLLKRDIVFAASLYL